MVGFEHPDAHSPVLGFALYAGAPPTAATLADAVRGDADAVEVRALPVAGTGTINTVVVAHDAVTVLLAPVDAPLPGDGGLRACHPVWWSDVEPVRAHRSHVIITALHAGARPDPRTQALTESTAFTLAAAAACRQQDAVALHAGSAGIAFPADAYVRAVEAAVEAQHLPVDLWTSVWLMPHDDGTHSAYTLGLDTFGHADLVVEHSRRPASGLYSLLSSLAAFLVTSGARLEPGQSVSYSGGEQLPVRSRSSGVHGRDVLEIGDADQPAAST